MAFSSLMKSHALEITRDGKTLTTYRFEASFTKPHFWPIIGPSGAAVTRQFPHVPDAPDEEHDHPHHRGLHFTHGEVSFPGEPFIDFWSEGAKAAQGRIVHVGFDAAPSAAGVDFGFAVHNRWLAPDGRVMLEDHTAWRITDLGRGATMFTARISLSPTFSPVIFGDTKEGSFSIRIPTSMDEQKDAKGPRSIGPRGHITNSDGNSAEKECWGTRADWVDYAGLVDGKHVGLTMFDHPDNQPRAFWHVRGYGLFAANPFGSRAFSLSNPRHDLKLEPGQKLALCYGLVVRNGESDPDRIAHLYREFLRTNAS